MPPKEPPPKFFNFTRGHPKGPYHAMYILGDRVGTGCVGENLDDCRRHIIKTVTRFDVSGEVELRSRLDPGIASFGLTTLLPNDLDLLKMVLNEEMEKTPRKPEIMFVRR